MAKEYIRYVAENAAQRAIPIQEIEEASAEDEEIAMLRKCVLTNDRTVGEPVFKAVRNELTVLGRLVLRGTRLVIPMKGSLRPSKDSAPKYGGPVRTVKQNKGAEHVKVASWLGNRCPQNHRREQNCPHHHGKTSR